MAAYVPDSSVSRKQTSFVRSRVGIVTLILALLLALFLIRPGAGRLRSRIVTAIGMALGRQVDVSSVHIRLLPHPGFDLENFVVHDDPAFSAEPVIRSQQVTAELRISSLLRGHLEIARLSLSEPSLNLVRDREGRWNLENLLERAAQIPVAPTKKANTEARPGFPYIEADRGRINLKLEQEKKPYALMDADFALWQESENVWGMRLKAQPVRMDFNLSDTGTVNVDGSWQRAVTLRQTPLKFVMEWTGAQLGQVSKLVSGKDKGWRGKTDTSVQDFRRYDILGGGALRLAAQCSSHYSSVDHSLSNLACHTPVGDGTLSVNGAVAGVFGARTYDLALVANELPLQSLIALARHAKKDIPDDLVASGKLNGSVKVQRKDAGYAEWNGSGESLGVRIGSKVNKTEMVLDRIPFQVSQNIEQSRKNGRRLFAPAEPQVEIGPFNLALGRPSPAVVRGSISRSGYSLLVTGDAQVQRLLQTARTAGFRAPQLTADGVARVDLQIAGGWSGFIAPQVTGKVQLQSVRAEVRGLNAPVEIASANLLLTPENVQVQNINASLSSSAWRGSLLLPRNCALPDRCPVSFDLHASQIDIHELNQSLNPHPRKQPWYRFLSTSPQTATPYLLTLHATGKLNVDRLAIQNLVATWVSAHVELESGIVRLSDLRGDLLGGKHLGDWQADFSVKPPEYSGSGTLQGIDLQQLAQAMRDGWVTGTATATYRASASGVDAAQLISSAKASLKVEVRDGLFPHIVLAEGNEPLHIHRLVGNLVLRDGRFEIQQGKLETPGGIYQLSGTASLTRTLDLKLVRAGAPGFNIIGPLTEPRVAPVKAQETQAALKP
ncbi:MAG: hypothetical protein DMG84_08280 [Acidobacteria bacterium]|nr:MAG: hypothetical protein DMG84_08280 [Acidobacteriota bacterium]